MKYNPQKMLEIALAARKNAYAPYSNFKVGAAIFGDDGQYYGGCNIENASYPQSQCAEPTALGAMIVAGGHHVEAVLVVSDTRDGIFPCGGCLQQLSEFVTSDTDVLIANLSGVVQIQRFSALFSMKFTHFFRKSKGRSCHSHAGGNDEE